MGIVLPKGMKVIRPLINMTANDVESFLDKERITIKRINSTGDKYFEYHREGCPIQFADIGVKLDENLYSDLKTYNDCITEYARKEGILASIHMPSTFIITIPRGYEKPAADYLKTNGLAVNANVNSSDIPFREEFVGYIYALNRNLLNTNTYEKVFRRFLERLELLGDNILINCLEENVICIYKENDVSLEMNFKFDISEATIIYSFGKDSCGRKDRLIFDNLILEMFRTSKYKIQWN